MRADLMRQLEQRAATARVEMRRLFTDAKVSPTTLYRYRMNRKHMPLMPTIAKLEAAMTAIEEERQ